MTYVYIQIGLLVVAVASAVLSTLNYSRIHRHRVIYEIKKHKLEMPTGNATDVQLAKANIIDSINEDLKGAKFTVLGIVPFKQDFHIFLGKIKK